MAPSSSSSSSSKTSSSSSSSSSFFKFLLPKLQRWSELVQRALSFNSQPTLETFPELVHVMIWCRALIAIGYGMFLGWDATRGAAGILLGFNVITFLPTVYCSTYLGANVESYGLPLFLGGVANALSLMMLVWIFHFTARHEVEEGVLTQLVNASFVAALQQQQQQQQAGVGGVGASLLQAAASGSASAMMNAAASAKNVESSTATFTLNIPAITNPQEVVVETEF